jgi:ribonuclease I
MENQEQEETSLEYFYDKVLDASEFYNSEYKDILDALNEAKKMYAEEIENAFKKGCYKGYKDHVNLTNTLNK